MRDPSKTNQELIEENFLLTQRIKDLEHLGTQCRQLELKVTESQRLIDAMLTASLAAFALHARNGSILKCNDVYAKRVGQSKSEILGKEIWPLLSPEVRENRKAMLEKVFREGQPIHMEDERLGAWNRTVLYPVLAIDNTVENVLVYAEDITERKKAEDTLKESEARWQFALEGAGDGIWDWNAVSNSVFYSSRWKEMLGYTEHEIGNTLDEWDRRVHPDDKPKVYADLERHFQGETETYQNEHRVLCKDASYKWILDRGKVIERTQGGKPQRVIGTHTDITERKQAEVALYESEKLFKTLFVDAPISIIIHDKYSGEIIDANPRAFTSYGFSSVDELKANDSWMDTPYSFHDALLRIQEAARKGPQQFEWLNRKKTGELFWEQVQLIPLTINGVERILATAIDITELKQVEAALRESEEKYRLLHENMMDGYLAASLKGDIQEFNSVYRNMVGYSEMELLRLRCQDLTPKRWHDFEQGIIDNQLLTRGYTDIYEKEYFRKDGSIFPVELRSYLIFDKDDKPTGYWAIVRDISARIEAAKALQIRENLLNRIIDILPVGLCIADKEGRLLQSNPMARKIWGAVPLVGKAEYGVFKARRLPSGEEVTPDNWSLTRSINEGISVVDELLEIDAFDGKKKIIINYSAPVMGDGGQIEGAIVVNHDVSELKHMQIENMTMQNRLRNAEKMEAMGTLSSGIAHDFNNILASIIGYTELSLMDESVTEAQDNYLRQVMKACERAKDLVNQILLFSQQREGEKKPVDVGIIVKEALKLLRASLPTSIKINQCISTDPCLISADPTQLHQIIMNLCTNAAHAMQKDGGLLGVSVSHMTVSIEMVKEYPDFVKIGPYMQMTVSDNGQGIDPSIIDKIFNPFFTTKNKGEGTGLGLSVVYGIVKSYDGVIQVQSDPGEGTTFNIYIPCIEGSVTEIKEGKAGQKITGGPESILLVDDEETLLLAMETYLKTLGYNVVSFANSPEALYMIQEYPHLFDLIITDMTMPHMTGLKLSRKILAINPEIPIILCTGYNETITEAKAKQDGIKEFVLKPIRLKDIAILVRKVLDGQ